MIWEGLRRVAWTIGVLGILVLLPGILHYLRVLFLDHARGDLEFALSQRFSQGDPITPTRVHNWGEKTVMEFDPGALVINGTSICKAEFERKPPSSRQMEHVGRMKRVNIEGIGLVDFPDEMSTAKIIEAIERDIVPKYGKQQAAPSQPPAAPAPAAPPPPAQPAQPAQWLIFLGPSLIVRMAVQPAAAKHEFTVAMSCTGDYFTPRPMPHSSDFRWLWWPVFQLAATLLGPHIALRVARWIAEGFALGRRTAG